MRFASLASRSVLALSLATPVALLPMHAILGNADLRPTLAAWKLEPRSQGGRGTCSVFAITQAIEWANAKEGEPVRLSPEFLNWASNDAIGVADDGFFSDLWKGFEKHGICAESALPYRDQFDPALVPSREAAASAAALRDRGFALHWIKPWDVTTGLTESQFDAIKATLDSGFPVCVGLRWPKAERWEGSTLQWADAGDVFDGHSVLFVGVREDPSDPSKGVFLVRNSNLARAEFEMPFSYAKAYANDAVWIARTAAAAPVDPRTTQPAAKPAAPAVDRPNH